MKPFPFKRLSIGDIFNDIDGTTFIRTGTSVPKGAFDQVDERPELNCMILIPNKGKDKRGQLRFKADDVYCELLDATEISNIRLENITDEPMSNE